MKENTKHKKDTRYKQKIQETQKEDTGQLAQLPAVVDKCIREGLGIELEAAGQHADVHRLQKLSDAACSHQWLWSFSSTHGPVLQPDEYVEAMRIRLSAAGPDGIVPCRLCGNALDGAGSHALCCALGETTRGHNAVRDELHVFALSADPNAEKKPLGFIPSHLFLRPADVLTSAANSGSLSALDVGIAAPEAALGRLTVARILPLRRS